MRREGTDPDNVRMEDVLCDFCRSHWREDVPVVEGHQGSIVCARCLTVAYTRVVVDGDDSGPGGYTCTMCLEQRGDPAWQSPAHPEAVICRRCIKLAAGAMKKDPESDWLPPSRGDGGE